MEGGNAAISEVLANLQSIFTGVESLGKAVEFGDKVAIPVYQFNFGTGGGGGGGGREGQLSSGVAFGLGGTISPVAIVVLSKDVPGAEGIKIHEFRGNKLGEAFAELISHLWQMIESQTGKREKLTPEKRERLMKI